ncbi:hypothetical protein GGR53DRAFT_138422 [Hypoxylon sp. FL1150]|nr:hypothetical protein GGR53DRAFT_138422 [Hypoxylon sp. FL1150]
MMMIRHSHITKFVAFHSVPIVSMEAPGGPTRPNFEHVDSGTELGAIGAVLLHTMVSPTSEISTSTVLSWQLGFRFHRHSRSLITFDGFGSLTLAKQGVSFAGLCATVESWTMDFVSELHAIGDIADQACLFVFEDHRKSEFRVSALSSGFRARRGSGGAEKGTASILPFHLLCCTNFVKPTWSAWSGTWIVSGDATFNTQRRSDCYGRGAS